MLKKVKGVLVVVLATAGVANAAVPAEVTSGITDLTTSATEYGAAFIGLAFAVALAGVGVKWVKRFVSKAS